jgi:multiple sugar transport system ATP-binding protein
MNLFDAPVADGAVDLEGFREPVPAGSGSRVTVGVRPEHLRMAAEGHGLEVTVDLVEELGADSYLHCSTRDNHPVVYRAESGDHPRKGDTMYLEALDDEVRFFDVESGLRLR